MTVRRVIARTWDTALALVAAVAAALSFTPVVINQITTEAIAFFTIQSAVIFPAMIFTAGLLKGEGLTVAEVDAYQAALRKQMHFWVTLLFLDLISVAMLTGGKAAEWKWKVTISAFSTNLGWVLVAIATFCGTLAILRMVPFVRGVVSLLELNSWMARKAVEARERRELTGAAPRHLAPVDFVPPKDYGKIIDPPKKKAAG